MKSIQFNASIPRYALGLVLGRLHKPLLWSGLSCTYAAETPEPPLPSDDWLRVKTRYAGICGSDLAAIHLKSSPYSSAFISSPFTLGHENLGVIAEIGVSVAGWSPGERVLVEPILWCGPRGYAPQDWCHNCARGLVNRCLHSTQGDLAPGLLLGLCRDTGGSWSQSFIAHQSQLFRLPASLSDENALLVEPFACGLHAALQHFPADGETVLIVGAGTIGLVTLAALRALGSQAEILVTARYPFQAEAARKLGASQVLMGGDLYQQVAERTGAKLVQPVIGKPAPVGGVDRTFECVGSDAALDDAIRLTRAGGQLVLVGMPGIAKDVDWSPIFLKELRVDGASMYHHAEHWGGRTWKTFELALDLMERGQVDLGWMVTHRYRLDQYDQALRAHLDKRQHPIIKAVFEFER